MITTRVDILLTIDAPNLYRFGYSETDDVLSVVNWQVGNPTFYDVKDGLKYFFVENIYNKSIPIIRLSRTVMCAACKLEIGTIRLVSSDPLVDDWEDIQMDGCRLEIGIITLISSEPLVSDWEDIQLDGDTADPLVTDWEDIQIDGDTSIDPLVTDWEDIQIDGDTTDPLVDNWEDIQIGGCVLQIGTITKT